MMKNFYVDKNGKKIEYNKISDIPEEEFSIKYHNAQSSDHILYASVWGPLLITELEFNK